jgi:hypothetical protein
VWSFLLGTVYADSLIGSACDFGQYHMSLVTGSKVVICCLLLRLRLFHSLLSSCFQIKDSQLFYLHDR